MKSLIIKDRPILSIITVVRNCEETIEETILSVINQNYPNIEYIIIDGMSTDNTLNIINKYKKRISHCVSESDNGIYDAMNKGIKLSTGDWVNFLNAGDLFYNYDLFNLIFDQFDCNLFDVVYGDFIAVDNINQSEVKVEAKPINHIFSGMVFSHQSVMIKSEIIKIYPFDVKYKIAADFDQILLLYISNYKFLNTQLIFSKITIDGVSYSSLDTIKEYISILQKHNTKRWILFYIPFLKIYFKQFLGLETISIVRKYKWKVERFLNLKS